MNKQTSKNKLKRSEVYTKAVNGTTELRSKKTNEILFTVKGYDCIRDMWIKYIKAK